MVDNRQKDTQMRPGMTKRTSTLALPMSFFVRIKGCVNGLEGFRQMIGMVALLLFANS